MTLSVLVWLFASSTARAAPQDIWVASPPPALRQHPSLGFAEGTDGEWVRFHADPAGIAALDAAGVSWRPALPPPPGLPEGYHTPESMVARLEALADAAPELVRLVTLGHSREGRPIVGLRISAAEEPAGQWRILGAHHGDELPSGEVALAFAELLVDSVGADADLTALLERDAVWVVPHVNPDGVAEVSRYNAAEVDLNRNYSYMWRADAYRSGTSAFSEPETRAVRGLGSWNPFQAGLSLHAGATNLGWVWNYTTSDPLDSTLVSRMAESYRRQCTDPDFWVTNGADWYITYGDTTDWSYGRRGVLDFTLELSTDKAPPAAQLDQIIADHLPAMRDFVLWPHRIEGQVVDAETGRGIPATVSAGGQPLTAGLTGRFAVTTPDDTPQSVWVYSSGYTPESLTIQPGEDALIALQPDNIGDARPEPVILSQGGDGSFQIAGETVTLHRPGEASVAAVAAGEAGAWQVDLSSMTPGAWDVEVDGQITPRALLVGEVDDAVRIDRVERDGEALVLSGAGFGAGSEVVGLWGPDRAPVLLDVLSEDEDALRVDVRDLQGTVDLIVWTAGYQLAVAGALDSGTVDSDPPGVSEPVTDQDSPSNDDTPSEARARGCATSGGSGGWLLLAGAVGIAGSRRMTA